MRLLVLELNDDGTVARTMFLEESSTLTLTSKHKSSIPDSAAPCWRDGPKKTAEQLRKEIVDEVKLIQPDPPGYDIRRDQQSYELVVYGPDRRRIGPLSSGQFWLNGDRLQTTFADGVLPPDSLVRWHRPDGVTVVGKQISYGYEFCHI